MSPRLPDDTQRANIVGRTGSGKTIAGLDLLSRSNITEKPWIVYDFKGDEWIGRIPYAEVITLDYLPKDPGVYIVRPLPMVDNDAVEKQMWAIWGRGNIGVYIDEGYMVQRSNKAFQALLTQGRSKRIPMIYLTQRPKMLPTSFMISEADFHRVYELTDENDHERVAEYIKQRDLEMDPSGLPRYHSYYYDVSKGELTVLRPASDPETIMRRFEARLKPPETKAEDLQGRGFIFL